jgi:ribosomal protein S18 acetylase RimI-like enzyme
MTALIPSWLAARVEDAGLNASAPPQQRWLDGWLVRFSAGKAKRARCINAVAPGRMPLQDKLALCQRIFDEAGLPLIFRVTPMSQPENLDEWLATQGLRVLDDTRVMVHPDISALSPEPLPDGLSLQRVGHAAFAQVVGRLRGSPLAQQQAHAQRLELAPVPFEGWVLRRTGETSVLACGQVATEAELVGLYDVFTAPEERNQGWARRLCAQLLRMTVDRSMARIAYLQVDADNHPARAVYRRLGFADAYGYHYRTAPDSVG